MFIRSIISVTITVTITVHRWVGIVFINVTGSGWISTMCRRIEDCFATAQVRWCCHRSFPIKWVNTGGGGGGGVDRDLFGSLKTVMSCGHRTLPSATEIWPGSNAPIQSTTTLSNVIPWHLCIVRANPRSRGSWLHTWTILPFTNWKKSFGKIRWLSLRSVKYTQTILSCIDCTWPSYPLTSVLDRFAVNMTGAPTLRNNLLGASIDFLIFVEMCGLSSLLKLNIGPSIADSFSWLAMNTSVRLENSMVDLGMVSDKDCMRDTVCVEGHPRAVSDMACM